MREILFRGKTYTGRWAYGSLILAGEYCCILEDIYDMHPADYPYLDPDLGTIDGRATAVNPKTVGQFTGLTDMEGIKIYEGDIVEERIGGSVTRYTVKFVRKRGGWYPFASGDGCGCCEDETITPEKDGSLCHVKVIGNIHDNPELTEEK